MGRLFGAMDGGVLDGFSKPLYTGWTKQTVSRERNVRLDGKLRPAIDESLSFDKSQANEERSRKRHQLRAKGR